MKGVPWSIYPQLQRSVRASIVCEQTEIGHRSTRGGTTHIPLLVALRPCAKNGILS